MSSDQHYRVYGIVIAILAALLGTVPAWGQTVIVDNTDPGFTVLSETWSTGSVSGQWGTDYRYKSAKDSPTGEVEWRPTIPATDDYQIAVWYPPAARRPNDAHYTIHYNGGTDDVYVEGKRCQDHFIDIAGGGATLGRPRHVFGNSPVASQDHQPVGPADRDATARPPTQGAEKIILTRFLAWG